MYNHPPLYDLIVRRYRSLGSIRAVAADLHVSHLTVRKVLITEGLYSTALSDDVQRLSNQGMEPGQIAKELSLSKSSVNAYLPYSKGTYLTARKSINARRIKACRERKKTLED